MKCPKMPPGTLAPFLVAVISASIVAAFSVPAIFTAARMPTMSHEEKYIEILLEIRDNRWNEESVRMEAAQILLEIEQANEEQP